MEALDFYLPTHLMYGVGMIQQLGKETMKYGKRAMIVTGQGSTKRTGLLDHAISLLKIVDPTLMTTMPKSILASVGFDAVEHTQHRVPVMCPWCVNACEVVAPDGGFSLPGMQSWVLQGYLLP